MSTDKQVHNSEYLLEVEHLKKYFPLSTNRLGKPQAFLRAVDDVSFKVRPGTTVGIVVQALAFVLVIVASALTPAPTRAAGAPARA